MWAKRHVQRDGLGRYGVGGSWCEKRNQGCATCRWASGSQGGHDSFLPVLFDEGLNLTLVVTEISEWKVIEKKFPAPCKEDISKLSACPGDYRLTHEGEGSWSLSAFHVPAKWLLKNCFTSELQLLEYYKVLLQTKRQLGSSKRGTV